MKKDEKYNKVEKSEAWLVAPASAAMNGGHRVRPVSNPIRTGKINGLRETSASNLPFIPRAAQALSGGLNPYTTRMHASTA